MLGTRNFQSPTLPTRSSPSDCTVITPSAMSRVMYSIIRPLCGEVESLTLGLDHYLCIGWVHGLNRISTVSAVELRHSHSSQYIILGHPSSDHLYSWVSIEIAQAPSCVLFLIARFYIFSFTGLECVVGVGARTGFEKVSNLLSFFLGSYRWATWSPGSIQNRAVFTWLPSRG